MKKLILFVGVLGVLAGSLAYTRGGDNIPDPVPVPDNPASEVVGIYSQRVGLGEHGIWIMFQMKDGLTVGTPPDGRIRMADRSFKHIKDVKVGELLWYDSPL